VRASGVSNVGVQLASPLPLPELLPLPHLNIILPTPPPYSILSSILSKHSNHTLHYPLFS
jgi:hypothetical protein